jgi:hypothetical protein
MSDENYVRACIILANFKDSDPEEVLINSWLSIKANRITRRLITTREWTKRDTPHALKLSEALRGALSAWVADAASARRQFRSVIDSAVDEIEVFTDLETQPDGRVVHRHRYVPHDNEAVLALLCAFLGDPERPFGSQLRQCPLNGCGQFFLSIKNAAGGPRPKYCSPRHTEEADRQLAAERQSRLRERAKLLEESGRRLAARGSMPRVIASRLRNRS